MWKIGKVLVSARALVLVRAVDDGTGRIPPLHFDVVLVAQGGSRANACAGAHR